VVRGADTEGLTEGMIPVKSDEAAPATEETTGAIESAAEAY
jgi:hypothetical protein